MTEPLPSPAPDPFLEEVRQLKQAASERFGNDIQKLAEHLREIERTAGNRVVPPPRNDGQAPKQIA